MSLAKNFFYRLVSFISERSFFMKNSSDKIFKQQLDNLITQLTEMIKQDIYENIIVATVQDWFEGNDSIKKLNEQIVNNVKQRWSFIERKIESKLSHFSDELERNIRAQNSISGQELDVKAISEAVSQSLSVAIGAIGTAFIAMISGGAGTALVATGPIGIIIGGIVGAFAFFLGKTKIEEGISDFIVDKKIPAFIKRTAKNKVATQLKLNEVKFEQEVYEMLIKSLEFTYKVLEDGFDAK